MLLDLANGNLEIDTTGTGCISAIRVDGTVLVDAIESSQYLLTNGIGRHTCSNLTGSEIRNGIFKQGGNNSNTF